MAPFLCPQIFSYFLCHNAAETILFNMSRFRYRFEMQTGSKALDHNNNSFFQISRTQLEFNENNEKFNSAFLQESLHDRHFFVLNYVRFEVCYLFASLVPQPTDCIPWEFPRYSLLFPTPPKLSLIMACSCSS